MNIYTKLSEHIAALTIIDTHEHLPMEADRPQDTDVLSEWLQHYFSCDLISAGMKDKELLFVKDSEKDLRSRWKVAEPYWHAAENTGYGRSLSIAAKELYGIDYINEKTVNELNKQFKAARKKGKHYKFVLKDKSNIAVSIRDTMPVPYKKTNDPFVYTMRVDTFLSPTHYKTMREIASEVNMEVHSLPDWLEVTKRHIEENFKNEDIVCLKCGHAYVRSLRFDKPTYHEAEKAFNEIFADRNLPDWRPPLKTAKVLEDYMMHFVCKVADEHKLTFQIHTGLQEGNGNFIYDSNPALLSNLFLEYRNVKFDIFHMGYPYVMELGNLAKNFRNVFIDMCWGHIISPEAAVRAIIEWLDAVPANKISAFGGDYCFVDGVYGHQAIARQNVAKALTKKVSEGVISLSRAKEIAQWMFIDNPARLFKLEKFIEK